MYADRSYRHRSFQRWFCIAISFFLGTGYLVLLPAVAEPDLSVFSSGSGEATLLFPPGGGAVTNVSISLEKDRKIHDFTLNLHGGMHNGSYPGNVGMDVGGDGTAEWSRQGILNRTVTVNGSDVADALTSILSSGDSGLQNVVLKFTSASQGRLVLSGLMVNYNGAPRVNLSNAPAGEIPPQFLEEDGSASYPGLDLDRFFDDDNGDELSYNVTNLNSGPHISARTENGRIFFSTTEDWFGSETLDVTATDPFGEEARASLVVKVNGTGDIPRFLSFDPFEEEVNLKEGDSITFSAEVDDPDEEGLNYRWFVGGDEVSGEDGTNYTYSPGYEDAGSVSVLLRVMSGSDYISHGWTVEVENVNFDPVAVIENPRVLTGGATYSSDVETNLSARGSSDPDGYLASYLWTSDRDGEVSRFRYDSVLLSPGNHTLTLTVTDDEGGRAYASVDVTVEGIGVLVDRDEKGESGAPWTIIIIIIAVAIPVAGAVAAAVIVKRRGRSSLAGGPDATGHTGRERRSANDGTKGAGDDESDEEGGRERVPSREGEKGGGGRK